MGNIIKLKTGDGIPTNIELVAGEVAVDTTNLNIYTNVGGTIKHIGTGGALKVAGGTMTGTLEMDDNVINEADLRRTVNIGFTNGAMTNMRDDDTMADDETATVCSQQSIKAYVDTNAYYPFHFGVGGYKTSNSSTTNYYMATYSQSTYYSWSLARTIAQMETMNYAYTRAAAWHAPSDGEINKIQVTGYSSGTNPFRIHIFKAAAGQSNYNTITTAQLVETGIITPSLSSEFFDETTTFTSSNTFSAGDLFWAAMKKTSSTGSKSYYFSVTVSGKRKP